MIPSRYNTVYAVPQQVISMLLISHLQKFHGIEIMQCTNEYQNSFSLRQYGLFDRNHTFIAQLYIWT